MSRQKVADPKKVNAELFALTYGAFVAQIVKDYENDEEVNQQLDKIGYNIGLRIVEDFLAKTGMGRCKDLRETADVISKQAFKMFLGVTPTVSNFSPAGDEFSLIFDQNPLTDFVELPEIHQKLNYSNVLAGAIRGALKNVQLEVSSYFVQDQLRGDPVTEIRVKFIRRIEEFTTGDD